MKKARKIVAIMFSAAIAVSALATTAQAAVAEAPAVQLSENGIQAYADVIVTKYRAY